MILTFFVVFTRWIINFEREVCGTDGKTLAVQEDCEYANIYSKKLISAREDEGNELSNSGSSLRLLRALLQERAFLTGNTAPCGITPV